MPRYYLVGSSLQIGKIYLVDTKKKMKLVLLIDLLQQ